MRYFFTENFQTKLHLFQNILISIYEFFVDLFFIGDVSKEGGGVVISLNKTDPKIN